MVSVFEEIAHLLYQWSRIERRIRAGKYLKNILSRVSLLLRGGVDIEYVQFMYYSRYASWKIVENSK